MSPVVLLNEGIITLTLLVKLLLELFAHSSLDRTNVGIPYFRILTLEDMSHFVTKDKVPQVLIVLHIVFIQIQGVVALVIESLHPVAESCASIFSTEDDNSSSDISSENMQCTPPRFRQNAVG